MKKLCVFAAILMTQAAGVHAQPPEVLVSPNMHLGVRGGLSIPSLQGGSTEESRGYRSRLGPDFGVFTDMPLSTHLTLEIAALYVGQGGVKKGMQPIPAGSMSGSGLPIPPDMALYARFKNESILNYLEIPILAKYTFDAGLPFSVYVDGGPNIGFLVSAKTKSSGTSQLFVDASGTPLTVMDQPVPPVDFTGEQSIKSDVNTMNFGLAGGLGIGWGMGPGELSLDCRGSYGLTNIQKGSGNGDNRTGCLVVTMGYAIGI